MSALSCQTHATSENCVYSCIKAFTIADFNFIQDFEGNLRKKSNVPARPRFKSLRTTAYCLLSICEILISYVLGSIEIHFEQNLRVARPEL